MPLVERRLPADFRWKGNRPRRRARLSPRQPEGRSLDSFKHLATSEKNTPAPVTMAEHLKSITDARDRQRRAYFLHTALMDTLKGLAWSETQGNRLEASYEAAGLAPMPDATEKKRRRRAWSPAKDIERLSGCQSEWIGFKPKCCESRAIAVPIGCNHRLCPLCNNHRAERYRKRVQALFHELSNPWLLTLTVPSPKRMSRDVLDTLRKRLKAFLKDHRALLMGGVYSIEITYNPREKTWHPHVHILVDLNDPRERIPFNEFRRLKWGLEFEWLLLTQGKNKRWKESDRERWMDGVRRRSGEFVDGAAANRRVIDLRPVTRDRKAAYEVLKYMAKASTFIGDAHALRQLLVAIRGVRQIQTFGSCYGFSIEDDAPEKHLKCECGANIFERIGVLGLGMVKLSPEGTWYVRSDAPVHGRQRCRGSSTHGGHEHEHGAAQS